MDPPIWPQGWPEPRPRPTQVVGLLVLTLIPVGLLVIVASAHPGTTAATLILAAVLGAFLLVFLADQWALWRALPRRGARGISSLPSGGLRAGDF